MGQDHTTSNTLRSARPCPPLAESDNGAGGPLGIRQEAELARRVGALAPRTAAAGPFPGRFAMIPAPQTRAPRPPPTALSPRLSARRRLLQDTKWGRGVQLGAIRVRQLFRRGLHGQLVQAWGARASPRGAFYSTPHASAFACVRTMVILCLRESSAAGDSGCASKIWPIVSESSKPYVH